MKEMAEILVLPNCSRVETKNKSQVNKLQQMLTLAIKGELRHFAYAYIKNDGGYVTGWVYDKDLDVHHMNSALSILKHGFIESITKEDKLR